MRAIPIPDGLAERMGGVRQVRGDLDLDHDAVRPIEYVVGQSALAETECVTALLELDDADRAMLAAGARLVLQIHVGYAWALHVVMP